MNNETEMSSTPLRLTFTLSGVKGCIATTLCN
jgi:hypothetical protein